MKKFNVTGNCIPSENYMVDISDKIKQIKKLIDNGYYFTINRARQYGKTTTLGILERNIKDEYAVASISFQGIGDNCFSSEENFCMMLMELVKKNLQFTGIDELYAKKWVDEKITTFMLLSEHITKMCKEKKVVLMIDEVDNASNNRVFVKFLNMLREKYIARRNGKDYTFHSVILAGVYDVKNIKLKMINEGIYTSGETENKIYNSPWNIAVDFEVDMAFNPTEIATMLNDYEADHKTGMNIIEISEAIYGYTSGYPFLVSRICQHIDVKLERKWIPENIKKAVEALLIEKNMLFDDMFKNIAAYADLKKFLYNLLFFGETRTYNIDNPTINLGCMFGYFRNENGLTKISNKIFEMRIYNYFISENENSGEVKVKPPLRSEIIENGRFNMEMFLKRFAQHYAEIYKLKDAEFLERHGGLLFLTYIKPFINGQGFCHIESQTNDFKIDIIVDYASEQFIIELKIWHGPKNHKEAYKQLANYLKIKNADTGYLLTFDFRKEANKERKAEWIDINDKKIFDVIL